jgi:hypothetical protein
VAVVLAAINEEVEANGVEEVQFELSHLLGIDSADESPAVRMLGLLGHARSI